MTGIEEKTEVLNAFFALVFNIRITYPEDAQLPEMEVVDGQR